jgi:hypothetical protein
MRLATTRMTLFPLVATKMWLATETTTFFPKVATKLRTQRLKISTTITTTSLAQSFRSSTDCWGTIPWVRRKMRWTQVLDNTDMLSFGNSAFIFAKSCCVHSNHDSKKRDMLFLLSWSRRVRFRGRGRRRKNDTTSLAFLVMNVLPRTKEPQILWKYERLVLKNGIYELGACHMYGIWHEK